MNKGLILIAEGFEECEALMVVDCVRRANELMDMVSINDNIDVLSAHQIMIKTDYLLKDIDYKNYDYLVIPGGLQGVNNLAASSEVSVIIDHFFNANKLICAICAGPSVISRLGYLDGYKYTVYPGFESYSSKAIYTADACTIDGQFITANGLGAIFEFVDAILCTMAGEDASKKVLDAIQYKY